MEIHEESVPQSKRAGELPWSGSSEMDLVRFQIKCHATGRKAWFRTTEGDQMQVGSTHMRNACLDLDSRCEPLEHTCEVTPNEKRP